MTNINRLPEGTVLKRRSVGKHGQPLWVGYVKKPNGEKDIKPVSDPNLGTVVENLLILIRRKEREASEKQE